ncbi:MAG: hypothetical protein F4Y80_08180 [Caldilineaceae bacterium SB0665_bin_21]|nr:hypothetical protein [Caldilineaceae bacterium SB0665_bin_21]
MTTGVAQPPCQLPAPISWSELIAAGRANLVPQPPATQPAPAAIRRAISTAYYAAFHAFTASNADVLAGPVYDSLTADAWIRIYRGLNHNQVRSQLQQNRSRFSANVQVFVDLLRDLQNERHNADYDPRATFTTQTAATWLNKADDAITNFLQASQSERAAVAIFTLVRTR